VGRFEIYRSSGVGASHAVGLILLENATMLTMAGLAGLMPVEAALVIAVGHRLIYVLTDGVLAPGRVGRPRRRRPSPVRRRGSGRSRS
jgi:hypothetical protein